MGNRKFCGEATRAVIIQMHKDIAQRHSKGPKYFRTAFNVVKYFNRNKITKQVQRKKRGSKMKLR